MNNRRKSLKQKKRFFMEKSVIIIVMFMFILLIGFNIMKVYNYYITAQFFKSNYIYNFKSNVPSQGIMEIAIEEDKVYPMLEIIINGELSDYKFEENNRIIITVCNGDVVQINGSMYNDNIKIEIENISPNISNVLDNNHIILREDINTLAVIRI